MINKNELKKLYITNTIMEYISVSCLVVIVLLLLSKVSNEPVVRGVRDIMLYVTMNTVIYLVKFMAIITRSLIFRHHTGTIINAFETEHGRYAITIEKEQGDREKQNTAVMLAPAPSYNMYVQGRQVEYISFLGRRYLCIF